MWIFLGHGALIGTKSGKVLNYSTRCKQCRTCSAAILRKKTVPAHHCLKNWHGSAKAMEPDIAVELVSELNATGVSVGELVMDDDTTTISRLHLEVDSNLTKSSDKNHVTKNFTNSLYGLQKIHRGFSYNIIKYFNRMFSLALHQNQNNASVLKSRLEAIVPHAFGNHTKCCDSWCQAVKMDDPSNYKYKGLPRHNALQGEKLKMDLQAIFLKYAENSEKLSRLKSSQPNEALNNSIARKAPKAVHYSGTASLFTRVTASIAEKNKGSDYLVEVGRNRKSAVASWLLFFCSLGFQRLVLFSSVLFEVC